MSRCLGEIGLGSGGILAPPNASETHPGVTLNNAGPTRPRKTMELMKRHLSSSAGIRAGSREPEHRRAPPPPPPACSLKPRSRRSLPIRPGAAPDFTDRRPLATERTRRPVPTLPVMSCGNNGLSWLVHVVKVGSQKCTPYCGEALGFSLMSGTARSALPERVSIPALKTWREKVRQ